MADKPKTEKAAAPAWLPGQRRSAPEVQKPRPESLPRHRLAGSHAGMYVTEHHRGAKRKG